MFVILVVENPNDQWTLDALARRAGPGVSVQSFTKPSYALAWLEANRAGIILASYRMPGMSCETFVGLCRNMPGRADTPIVVAAAAEDAGKRPALLEAGVDEVIIEPEDEDIFFGRLRSLLETGGPVGLETGGPVGLEAGSAAGGPVGEARPSSRGVCQTDIEPRSPLIALAMDSIDQGVVITDANLCILAVNKRQGELMGEQASMFKVGASVRDIIVQAAAAGWYGTRDSENPVKTTLDALQNGQPFRMQRTNGVGSTIEIVIRPLPGGGCASIFTDITEQNRNAEVLIATNQRLTAFAESTFDWYWETDIEHRFCDIQNTFFDCHPVSPMQVLGKTRWAYAGGDPERDELWREHRETLNAGRPFRDFRYAMTDANGQLQYWRISGKPIFDAVGRFSGYQGAASCETELFEARLVSQQEYSVRADLLQATFDSLSQGLIAIDRDMLIIAANSQVAKVLKQSPEAFAPGAAFPSALRGWIESGGLGSHDHQHDIDMFFEMARNRQDNHFERELASGEALSVRINPLPNGGNVITFTDITKRAVADERLRHGQKLEALGQMAGGIAHEFNNLLTSLSGFAHMALKKPDDKDRVITCLEEIAEVSGRAIEITRQMLTFSHKQVLAPAIVRAGETVRGMEKLLHAFIPATVELSFEVSDDEVCIEVDPARLSQCIVNLVNNSRHAMPDGGKVTVCCETVAFETNHATKHGDELAQGFYVRISVADTGTGIDPASMSRIFDPFYTTKDAGAGTGLGLSLVYGMVTNSNGAIDVESEIGMGTTFSIYLPVADREPDALPAPKETRAAVGPQTVLVAEDDAHLRRFVQIALEDNGFAVITAPDGEAALELYEEHADNISILVTDVVMPKMSGVKLAKAIGAKDPSIRVLFISGYAPELSEHVNEIAEGAAFMRKPFDPDDLGRKVREILNSGSAAQKKPNQPEPSRAA
ncbi:MAG: PAS-domain containing protein [Alphaproteobacteria bacterium]